MFIISEVLLNALRITGISPSIVNTAYDRRVLCRQGPMTEVDRFPREISKATGQSVHFLRRSNRRLLITFGNGIRYTEFGLRHCELILPIELPATLRYAMAGTRLDQSVDVGSSARLFGKLRVRGCLDSYAGSSAFLVEPGWTRFV